MVTPAQKDNGCDMGLPIATTPDISAAGPAAQFDALNLLSRQGALRTGGSLRELLSKYHGIEGLVALNAGLPPPSSYPLTSLQFGLASGTATSLQLSSEELTAGQQYNIATAGYPPLHSWVAAHVAELHSPPGPHRVLLTCGASQGLELVCSLFLDDKDSVVVEEYTYPQMLECSLAPRSCRVLPAPMDEQGILPAQLEQVLQQAEARGDPKPKLLYTVPTGQNPTGVCTSLERKRAVYDICSRHGLLILEDDAYAYLQFPDGTRDPPGLMGLPRASSYLSLDWQGRVVRLDTCAKFLAPGLRLGWATAPPAVADKLAHLLHAQTLGPSGLSQVIAFKLLQAWGPEGLHQHLQALQAGYAASAAALHEVAQRELAGLAEWRQPRAGMFMWVRLLGVEESADVLDALREAKVVVVPGRVCHPRGADPAFRCPYVRLSFSHLPPRELEEGVRRLATVLRGLQQQQEAGG